jgi:hypothetical protein
MLDMVVSRWGIDWLTTGDDFDLNAIVYETILVLFGQREPTCIRFILNRR